MWDEDAESDVSSRESHGHAELDGLAVGIWDPQDGECLSELTHEFCRGLKVSGTGSICCHKTCHMFVKHDEVNQAEPCQTVLAWM